MEPTLEKKTLPHLVGKAEGLGDSLPSPQSCMPHHIDGMAGNSRLSSIRLPLLNVVEGAATLCIPGTNDHHQVTHMPAMGKL